jgi:hypothetical protein
LTRASPAQASEHTGHRQFHCGKPPPAAAPSTMAVRFPIHEKEKTKACRSELGRKIAVDLEADADFDEGGCGPGHDRFLSSVTLFDSAVPLRIAAQPMHE